MNRKIQATDRESKAQSLKQILQSLESVLVAYSGGVDSTLLLAVAREVLGNRAMAATITSVIYPAHEIEEAKIIAGKLGAAHIMVPGKTLDNPAFTSNPVDRCYWCKKEVFGELVKLARGKGIKHVVDGTNADDANDYRPGMAAVAELGIRSPLLESGLTKNDIRCLSKGLGLQTWDKPSYACLASRFPYGTVITEKNIRIVARAEDFLRELGIGQLRVRHHGNTARIEVSTHNIPLLLREENRKAILVFFKTLGYLYVTIDLEGYRSGSLNEAFVSNP